MKKFFLLLYCFLPVLMYSCKSGGGDPKAVLIKFFDAIKAKDIPAAKKLATEDSKQLLDLMETGMKMQKDQNEDNKFDKSKMEFGEPKIDGDKAIIAVKGNWQRRINEFYIKKRKRRLESCI
jgi:hypothetical protein